MQWRRIHRRCFAFVLGISAYRHAPPLRNPPNDCAAIAAALRRIGYKVDEWQDLDVRNIAHRIDEFLTKACTCDTILFYYSGHGVQLAQGGTIVNYIVPVDFSFEAEDPASLLGRYLVPPYRRCLRRELSLADRSASLHARRLQNR